MTTRAVDDPARDSQAGSPAPSDRSLLRRLRGGSEDAATELYLRYATRLHALAAAQCSPDLARRVDPDDVVQSVFRTFFRRAARGEYEVPAGEELWKLFLVIALNKIRAVATHHRAAKRDVRLTAPADALEFTGPAAVRPDEAALTLLRLTVEELLESLPEAQRRIVELRIEENEVAEIARLTGRSKRTVERVLQQFRTRLDAILRGDD
jgi:RNA polymerase sigma-70 factor (ECF subfamily)